MCGGVWLTAGSIDRRASPPPLPSLPHGSEQGRVRVSLWMGCHAPLTCSPPPSCLSLIVPIPMSLSTNQPTNQPTKSLHRPTNQFNTTTQTNQRIRRPPRARDPAPPRRLPTGQSPTHPLTHSFSRCLSQSAVYAVSCVCIFPFFPFILFLHVPSSPTPTH
jgi:hypothetical protein